MIKKYRIILVKRSDLQWYEVERKLLFWWISVRNLHVYPNGEATDYNETFPTYDLAKKFVDSLAGERRKVIQVIETI